MNILHISTYDYGGAGTAAYRLHKNLLDEGVISKMAVLKKKNTEDNIFEVGTNQYLFNFKNLIGKIFFKLRTNQNYYFQQQSHFNVNKIVSRTEARKFRPDIIVAHWISNFIAIEDLFKIHKIYNVPIVWYLLDMSPLTGGCHYAWDCTGYTKKCGYCPALSSSYEDDMSYRNWTKKKYYIKQTNITMVAATEWLHRQVESTSLFAEKSLSKIPLAVDPNVFTPIPKEIARSLLNLPRNKKIIFIGSQSLRLERKGVKYFIEALNLLVSKFCYSLKNVLVVTAGEEMKDHVFTSNAFKYKHLGFLKNDNMLASAYQAADLFVCPSIEDSGPMMINESIMSGTPVVAFDMGVAPDLVHSHKTGYRAVLRNSEDLANGIMLVLELSSDEAKKMSNQCRMLGMKLCQPHVQVQSFTKLIRSILCEMNK